MILQPTKSKEMKTINELCDDLQTFCDDNNLPYMSADELLYQEDLILTKEQKDYLKYFISFWDKANEQ